MFSSFKTPENKPLTFHEKRNCAPKALEYVNKRDIAREKKITLYEFNELQNTTVDFFLEKEKDLLSCPHTKDAYACIIVGIDKKAKVEFVDVSDEVNHLEPELKDCLSKKLKSYDYKSLKAKQGTKFTMPLKFSGV